MKIATKTLATVMLVVMLTISTATMTYAAPPEKTSKRNDRKLERIYRHHDRKLELRASVLGISSDQLREELKARNFDGVIKQYGFKDRQSFHTAVIGKLKDELKRRGWSEEKINKLVQKKLERFAKKAE